MKRRLLTCMALAGSLLLAGSCLNPPDDPFPIRISLAPWDIFVALPELPDLRPSSLKIDLQPINQTDWLLQPRIRNDGPVASMSILIVADPPTPTSYGGLVWEASEMNNELLVDGAELAEELDPLLGD